MTLHLYAPRLAAAAADTVPDAPAAPTVSVGAAQLTASWSAPASDGGSAITSYGARRSVEGAETWTQLDDLPLSPLTLTGLTNGTAYEVQVRAVNAVGPSAWSASGVATPQAASYAVRSVTNSNTPAGTSLSVPPGAVTGDTLIFIASRDYDISGSILAPSGATAVGTPVDQTGGYPSFLVWRILSWNGSTNTYDFGWSGSWAGERCIICIQGTSTAVTAGTYTTAAGTDLAWTGLDTPVNDVNIAVVGLYNPGLLPVIDMDPALTVRKTQAGWAGLGVWTKTADSPGVYTPSPVGSASGTANSATLLLKADP